MEEVGSLPRGGVHIFWTSPGYSSCCFTADNDTDIVLSQKVTQAFVSKYYPGGL